LWESEKETLFQVPCHWGIICVFGFRYTLTLSRNPNNNKIIITVASGAVVFVMKIIMKVGRGSVVHNAMRRKLPRGPALKE